MIKNIFLGILAIVLVVSCTSLQKNPVQLGELSGNWKLNTLNGTIVSSEQPLTLELTNDNNVFGFAGCNRLMGKYSFTGDNDIVLSDLGSTRMMCSQPEMDLETKYMDTLESVRSTSIENGLLVMYNSNNDVVATFEKNDHVELSNTSWKLDELNGRTVTNTNPVTLSFASDNTISGNAGCNRLIGNFSATQGNRLDFSDLGNTLMMCSDDEMKLEQDYLNVLKNVKSSKMQNGQLLLLNSNNNVIAKFSNYEEPKMVNKYWKLTELEGQKVVMDNDQEREQYLMLKSDGTITGFAGCNQFNGTYTIDEENNRLRINDNLGVTLKNCPNSKANERHFLEVLTLADSYTIDDDTMRLIIGKRAPLAVFEAVYF